jgi:hypothetical protein
MLGSSSVAAQLAASQEGHSSMKLVCFVPEIGIFVSHVDLSLEFPNYNLWLFCSSRSMFCALIIGDCHRCFRMKFK